MPDGGVKSYADGYVDATSTNKSPATVPLGRPGSTVADDGTLAVLIELELRNAIYTTFFRSMMSAATTKSAITVTGLCIALLIASVAIDITLCCDGFGSGVQ